MFIDEQTKLYGIFGYPLGHTLSPVLHSFMFDNYSINAVYLSFETKDIKEAVKSIKTLHMKGVNITIPHKEKALEFVDSADDDAVKIKAINTIKNINGQLHGYNTDYLGFIYMIEKNIENYSSKKFTVLGAGGASKAVIYALYKLGVQNINVLNRTKTRALELKTIFHNMLDINISDLNNKKILQDTDVLINTTSIGLDKKRLPIDINYIDKTEVLDIIYIDSPLISKTKERGCKAINGMDMFIGQAFYSFKIWTGIEFDKNLAKTILTRGKQ